MNPIARCLLATAVLAAGGGALAQATDTLDVQLSLPVAVVHGNGDIAVDVAIVNSTGHEVTLTRWQLPSQELQGPLFRITRDDGTQALYDGVLVKRGAATQADLVHLAAGAALNYRVELSHDYEIGSGRYSIEYLAPARRVGDASLRSLVPQALLADGRTVASFADTYLEDLRKRAGGLTFTGHCSASQKTDLKHAVDAATDYATESGKYLAGTPQGTERYVQWFGEFTEDRWDLVHLHFAKEKNAFKTKPISLDCSCTSQGTYAYVHPNQPYKIFLCGAFWRAPMTGTDSKGGTLIHEMSHFYVVAGTHDWVYGQTAAAQLARTNPDHAVDNADNHEYFAENNPFLP